MGVSCAGIVVVVVVGCRLVVVVAGAVRVDPSQHELLTRETGHAPASWVVGAPPPQPCQPVRRPSSVVVGHRRLVVAILPPSSRLNSRLEARDSSSPSIDVCHRHQDGVAHWPMPAMTASWSLVVADARLCRWPRSAQKGQLSVKKRLIALTLAHTRAYPHTVDRGRPDRTTLPIRTRDRYPVWGGETGTHYLPQSPIVPGLVSVSPGRRIE